MNDKFIEKNDEFVISKSELETFEKIDEYLKTGKSQYVDEKSIGLAGKNTHWYVVVKNIGKIKMIKLIELFRIK